MPSIAYVVLAHHLPEQLARMLTRTLGPADSAVVHIDATTDITPFRDAAARCDASITFAEHRLDIRWGDFSAVQATVDGLRQLAAAPAAADYVSLITGTHYPIKPIDALRRELTSGAAYINCWAMPDDVRGKPISRLEYRFVPGRQRGSGPFRILNKALATLPARNVAKGLQGHPPFGGSAHWALPMSCVRQMLRFIDDHPRFVRFFRFSGNPDETFFQTTFRAACPTVETRPAFTFSDWTRPESGGTGPATLRSGDLPLLASVNEYFARKFDSTVDGRVLDLVDHQLLAEPS